MQRASDRHDVEAADVRSKRFGFAFDQRDMPPSTRCGLSRGLDHRRFGIDADDAADIGPEAECQEPWSGTEIDQAARSGEAKLLRDAAKEFARIRRPQMLVE